MRTSSRASGGCCSWRVSNAEGWIVLTTGNKSEMATGLLDAVRRLGRRVRRDQGRLRRRSSTSCAGTATRVAGLRPDPRAGAHQGAVGRAAPRPTRRRVAAALRGPRPGGRRLRGGRPIGRGARRRGVRPRGGGPGRGPGRPGRVQAPSDAPGGPHLGQGLRQGSSDAHHQPLPDRVGRHHGRTRSRAVRGEQASGEAPAVV